MLFLNSFFSYLIRKFATYNRLKPPCFFCSNIDHLLEPKSDVYPFQNLICESHAIDFHANSVDRYFNRASKIKSNYEENEGVEVIKVPVENKSGHIQVFDQIIPLEWTDSSTSCSRSSSLNGDENLVFNNEYHVEKQGKDCKLTLVIISTS